MSECKCEGFVVGPITSCSFCLDCKHGIYYHQDGPCRHNDQPEAKIRTMRDICDKCGDCVECCHDNLRCTHKVIPVRSGHYQAIVQKIWREAAQYVNSKPCLGWRCLLWAGFFSRIPPEDPRRHNMHCPKFIAYVFRANADRENYL